MELQYDCGYGGGCEEPYSAWELCIRQLHRMGSKQEINSAVQGMCLEYLLLN